MRLILLPFIMLAACQQAPDTSGATNNAAVAEPIGYSQLQQRVVDLPQGQRDGVLLRAIRDGDAPCQGVQQTIRQEDQDGNPVYVARCADGPIYAIAIDRNGVAQVTRVSAERRG